MWKQFRRRLEALALAASYSAARWIPWRALRRLAGPAGALIRAVDARSRRVARENLRLAFPELDGERREAILRDTFRSIALNALEILCADRLRSGAFDDYVEFPEPGLSRMRALHGSGRGMVVATFHIGNWEWFSLACAHHGIVADIVAQQIKNRRVDAFVRRKREGLGHRVLYAEKGIRQLFRSLKEGRTVGLLVDLNMPRERGGAYLRFFGRPAMSTVAAAALARKTGAALVVAHDIRGVDGRYRIEFHELPIAGAETDEALAQKILDIGEAAIRRHPGQWIWMYKRWKFRPKGSDPADFPFYSYEA